MLIFDEEIMTFAMGNCIVMEDTNGNRKLLKKRNDQKLTPLLRRWMRIFHIRKTGKRLSKEMIWMNYTIMVF